VKKRAQGTTKRYNTELTQRTLGEAKEKNKNTKYNKKIKKKHNKK